MSKGTLFKLSIMTIMILSISVVMAACGGGGGGGAAGVRKQGVVTVTEAKVPPFNIAANKAGIAILAFDVLFEDPDMEETGLYIQEIGFEFSEGADVSGASLYRNVATAQGDAGVGT